MDFFKGIGDFFGGLFGKKKEEEKRPQVQQPQPSKAVEFNKPQSTSVFGSSAVNDINQKQNTLGKSANDVFNGLNKAPKIEAFKPQENQAVQPVKPVPQIKNPYSQEHANLDKGVGQGVLKKEVLDSFNKPTQRPFESAKDFDDRRMNEAIARGDTKQLEEIRNDFQKKSFNTGLFGTSKTDYFDKVNKLNSQITDLALKNNDEALLMRQQGNTRHINNLLANESKHNNTGIVKAVRELPDTLNPMSNKGLFGVKQQQSFERVSRPVNTELKKYNDWVDQGDSKAGFQWDDLGDYWRFAQKLPSGMVSGTLEAPNKVGGAMTGKYIDKDGKLVDKNALQRAAMLGDAYISTGGLAHGASGTLLKSLGKSTATQAGKETVKTGAWNTVKDLGKGILTEGVEESTQSLLGEIADRGHFDNGTIGRTLEAGAQIYKEWVVVSANPCKYCRGMNGRRVNVTESYVKKGGILIGKSKIRVNDYADIDTAGAHPNCSCVEKFGIEEEKDKIFDYSKLSQNDPEYMHPHEQDFYERLVKNFNNVERVPKHKTKPSNDFIINGEAWELKSILGKVKPMTIRNEIYHATDKGKRNIFLDVYNQDIDVNDVIEKAKKHISIKKNNDKIDSLIVVSGDKFHKIK